MRPTLAVPRRPTLAVPHRPTLAVPHRPTLAVPCLPPPVLTRLVGGQSHNVLDAPRPHPRPENV